MQVKVPDNVLVAMLAACPAIGLVYRHYKNGHRYVIAGSAISEATQEPLVVYQRWGSPLTFARPLSEWDELVEHEGKTVRRFTQVPRAVHAEEHPE